MRIWLNGYSTETILEEKSSPRTRAILELKAPRSDLYIVGTLKRPDAGVNFSLEEDDIA